MTPAPPRFLSAAFSHTGFVRGNNEDRVYTDDTRGIYLVVDGMGGHEGGEHAAEIAVERIRPRLERPVGSVEQRLREAITLANNEIFETAQTNAALKGMACVLTAAVIEENRVTIGHVGDSRLYRIHRGRIDKITHDHSPVGEREDSGALTEAQAMQHPRRNEVYRDVGSEPHTPNDEDFIEIIEIPIELDSALLLCSDGLSDAISSLEILGIVQNFAGNRDAAVQQLVAAAIKKGKDNVSAVLVEGPRFAPPPSAEITERLRPLAPPPPAPIAPPAMSAPPPRAPRRKSAFLTAALFLLLGLIVGTAAMAVYDRYYKPAPAVGTGPVIIAVKAGDSLVGALEKAKSGDTITVAAGTYAGPLKLKDGVDVLAQPAHDAIIEGGVSADNVRHARFEGFQVKGAAGIRIHDSAITLARDEISGAREAGVQFSGSSHGSIIACYVHNNTGAGILIRDTAAPAVENNVITANGLGSGAHPPPKSLAPGLSLQTSSDLVVTRNSFAGNGAEAIWLTEEDEDIVTNNFFNVGGAKPDRHAKTRVVILLENGHEPR